MKHVDRTQAMFTGRTSFIEAGTHSAWFLLLVASFASGLARTARSLHATTEFSVYTLLAMMSVTSLTVDQFKTQARAVHGLPASALSSPPAKSAP